MIFVTVGSERFPFDRLISAVDELAQRGVLQDVHCQIGASTYRPKHCRWKPFLPFKEMLQYVQESELIIAHGGVGVTLLCLQMEKVPILVPRRKALGEHVDDHQLEFAAHIAQLGAAVVVQEVRELESALEEQRELQRRYSSDEGRSAGTKGGRSSLSRELERLLSSWDQQPGSDAAEGGK
jgi:UDP-N-acetylglucosamine transferase subunit ALG13